MAKIYTSDDKKLFVDRFFLSYEDEEQWLNEMAASGMYLVKKTFYRYYFKKDTARDVKYSVELLEHPASNPLSADIIEEKRKKGISLVAYYKCKAYFQMSPSEYSRESYLAKKSRVKSVACMFAVYLICFITSVLMMCYHCVSSLNFTISNSAEGMSALSEEFSFFGIFVKLSKLIKLDSFLGNYQSTPLILMFFILTVVFAIPVAVYFRELFLALKKRK